MIRDTIAGFYGNYGFFFFLEISRLASIVIVPVYTFSPTSSPAFVIVYLMIGIPARTR